MTQTALNNFADQLSALLRNVRERELPRSGAESPIIRLSRKIEDCDPLELLAHLNTTPALYWRARERALEVAGFGVADSQVAHSDSEIESLFARLTTRLSSCSPSARYFGGVRFDATVQPSRTWRDFAAATFILPRVEVIQQGGSAYVALNITQDRPLSEQLAFVEELMSQTTSATALRLPKVHAARVDTPSQRGWGAIIQEVLSLLEASSLEKKIVISRSSHFTLREQGSAALLLKELLRYSPFSYGYLFSPTPGVTFLGASPERLFARQGRTVLSEALAGTTGRGSNQEHDRVLADDLLNSRKNRVEHALVLERIAEQLEGLCIAQPRCDATTTIKSASVQHLYSAIRGELRDGITDGQILRTLHPTPAVCGTPTNEAKQFIAAHEGYDRGWYTGPFGAIGSDETEFAVAIRSALIHGDSVTLFAGGGIVSGSDERSEWSEIEAKIAPYVRLLEGDQGHA
jgi:menaquinone-specific isochorismate synthase